MPGMRFTIGIIRYFNNGPAFRTTLVAVAPPGETAYTAMPEGSRRASAAAHQAMMSFASAYALLGTYFTFGPLRSQGFNSGGSVTLVVFGREGRHVGVLEHGHAPAGRLRAGDNNPRVGAQKVGAKQPDSQLMMADQRGLRSLDARRSDHALLAWDHPGIEQQEIDRPTSFDQLGEGGLDAGRRVQLQLQRREDLSFGFRRELSGRFLGPSQAAPGDDDLAPALFGKRAGCCITEPGGGAGDERDRMFHGRLRGEG